MIKIYIKFKIGKNINNNYKMMYRYYKHSKVKVYKYY